MSTDVSESGDTTTAIGAPTAIVADPAIDVGSVVGRYVVVGELGRGGMGRVLRAYDPKLEREVALKVLRSPDDPDAASRLLREAQAMAKMSSPHIVAVYDVDTQGTDVYIAMEYVRGATLRRWLEQPRRHAEILRVFIQAGRGLAAAHAAGLIHRDFKPSNVLLGADGRAQVTDFGLVRVGTNSSPSQAGSDTSSNDELTRAGDVMGTPPYMPPEQHRGAELSEASDQFAFCVSLYEGLVGHRPFAAKNLEELLALKERSEVAPFDRSVPRWLRRAVLQGLAPDPAARWPSMRALLDHIDQRSRSRRAWVAVATVLAGGTLSMALLYGGPDEAVKEQCQAQASAAASPAWSDAARDRAREAFMRSEANFAAPTFERVDEHMQRYLSEWKEHATQTCLDAARADATKPTARRECLDEGIAAARSMAELLADADVDVIRSAIEVVLDLPAPQACAHAAPTPEGVDPEASRQVQAVRRRLWNIDALLQSYRTEQAQTLAAELSEQAESLDAPPLSAELYLREGRLARALANYAEARTLLERSYFLAGEHHRDEVAADAAKTLAHVVGLDLGKVDEGLAWLRHATMCLRRLQGDQTLRRSEQLMTEAQLHDEARDLDRAESTAKQALELRERSVGEHHPSVAGALLTLGHVLERQGRFDDAEAAFRRALTIKREVYGDQHPTLERELHALGIVAAKRGDNAAAQRQFEQAHELAREALGETHPETVRLRASLAVMLSRAGKYEEALEHFEWSLAQYQRVWGPEHPDLVAQLANTAIANKNAGNFERARDLYERSIALSEKLHGPDHPDISTTLSNLGTLLNSMQQYDEALVHLERAATIARESGDHMSLSAVLHTSGAALFALEEYEQAYEMYQGALAAAETAVGPDAKALADSLQNLTEIAMLLDDYEAARRWHERERAMVEGDDFSPSTRAFFLLNEARLAAHDGASYETLEAIIEEAIPLFESLGPLYADHPEQAHAWLQEQRTP